MANIKSQIKRNRQNDKRRLRNRVVRGGSRVAVKNARSAIDAGAPESKEALLEAVRALDKAAEKGVLHKNNAARRKGRLMKAFNHMEPIKKVEEPKPAKPVVEEEPASKTKKAPAKKTAAKVETTTKSTKSSTTKKPAAKKPAAKKTSAAKKTKK